VQRNERVGARILTFAPEKAVAQGPPYLFNGLQAPPARPSSHRPAIASMDSSPPLRPFPQAGEMARLLNEFDWSATELGPPGGWPSEFRAQVHAALDSRIPMMLGWGPDFRLIYNDGYIPIMGEKHPVIWQSCAEAFQELWHQVGPILEEVYRSQQPVMMENALLPLARQGFLEACYFTFSYSPLRDRDGKVAGLLSVAVETTGEVLASRRERLLSEIAEPVPHTTALDAVAHAAAAMTGSSDVPCHLVLVRHGADWQVAAAHGLRAGGVGAERESIDDLDAQVPALLERLSARPGALPERIAIGEVPGLVCALDDPTVEHVLVLPFEGEGPEPHGIVVLGTHPMLVWDEAYAWFCVRVCGLLSGHFAAQRLRELTLAEAEDRYHELFLQALDGIILGRPSGDILAANPAACRILGYTEAELVAGGRALVRDPTDERWTRGLAQRADTGGFAGELSWLHKEGHRVPCEVTSRVYETISGEQRTTLILRDISERLTLQAQLAEAQKVEAVGRISGGIAHDFNNLLAVIDLQADLLREAILGNPEALAELDLLSQTSRRAAALIRRLLDFTRRSHGEPRVFQPTTAITEMASLLRRLVGSGCELTFDFEEEVPALRMAPHQFEQVIMNLVVNARDAVEATGRSGVVAVRLSTDGSGEQVQLEVRDDGIGIQEDVQARIFDAFYTTKAHGTGIGLNTVRLLSEGLGGSVSIESTPGEGSVFTVCLPAWSEDRVGDDEAPVPPLRGRLDGIRILLVEDQAQLRGALTKVLRRGGAKVVAAANGEEALRHCEDMVPDVLVTDVVMPLLSGPELVRRLREFHPGLAVVLMSGYAGDETLPPDVLSGARFLTKPFSEDVLIEAILEGR